MSYCWETVQLRQCSPKLLILCEISNKAFPYYATSSWKVFYERRVHCNVTIFYAAPIRAVCSTTLSNCITNCIVDFDFITKVVSNRSNLFIQFCCTTNHNLKGSRYSSVRFHHITVIGATKQSIYCRQEDMYELTDPRLWPG